MNTTKNSKSPPWVIIASLETALSSLHPLLARILTAMVIQNTSEFDINQFTLLAAWCSCDLVMAGSSISNMEMMLSQCNYPQNTHTHFLFFSDCQLVPVNAFPKSFWDLFSIVYSLLLLCHKRQNMFLIKDQAIVEDHFGLKWLHN